MSNSLLKKPKVAKWRQDTSAIEKYQFIYSFLPHPQKRSRAKLLSFKALNIYCMAFLTILLGVKGFTRVSPGVLGFASDIKIRELLELSNSRRHDIGLEKLRLNPALTKAAEQKALDMFEKDYWAHVSPEGVEPWDFILAEDYNYVYAGENLAKNFSKSRDVVDAWYNSPSHRENLLNKNYVEVGFAVVNGVLDGYETTLVVQMFGKPRDLNYVATEQDESNILSTHDEILTAPVSESEQPAQIPFIASQESNAPAVDLSLAIKSISILFMGYLLLLLVLDIWYSKKHSIYKLSGHTVAHVIFLLVSMIGMLFALLPGKIL